MRAKTINENIGDILKPKSTSEINAVLDSVVKQNDFNQKIDNILIKFKNNIMDAIVSKHISTISGVFSDESENFLSDILISVLSNTFNLNFEKAWGRYDSYWMPVMGYSGGGSRTVFANTVFNDGYVLKLAFNGPQTGVLGALFKNDNLIDATPASQTLDTAVKNIQKLLKKIK